jgi:hypothetical protein
VLTSKLVSSNSSAFLKDRDRRLGIKHEDTWFAIKISVSATFDFMLSGDYFSFIISQFLFYTYS